MRRFRILIISLLALCLSIQVVAQKTKTDAMLFGHTQSEETKEHIPFVSISVKGTNIATVSDASGHFKLANLPLGKCTIVFQAVGYKPLNKEVFMEKNKGVELYVTLKEDILCLDQVVVTGTRTAHYLKDVPIRTEVVNSKTIENRNATSLYQALEGVPGIRVEQQCQACNFAMVRMQGLGAEHTQMLINGQPMYSGLAGVYGLQQLGTFDVDRIEVVKGAGSALYGSSAVAGAINIVTKEPSYIPSTKMGVQMGSYGTNVYDIASSLRNEKGNIGALIYAERRTGKAIDQTGDGDTRSEVKHKDGVSDRVETALNSLGFNLYIDNPFSDNKEKLVIRGAAISEMRVGGVLTDNLYKNPYSEGTENITTNRYTTDLNYSRGIGNNSEINFSASFVNHKRDATNDSFLGDYMATHNDEKPDLEIMRPYVANENSFNSSLTFSTIFGRHSLLFGAQVYLTKLKESGLYVITDESDEMKPYYGIDYKSSSNKSAREFGLFVQDEWAVTDKIMIVPGVRFDSHHSNEEYTADKQVYVDKNFPKTEFSENTVNPRIAIKYEISSRFSLRANFGTGFRAPYGFSEDLHLCSGSPRVWKSSGLKPEKSMSFNLSGDYYGEKFRLSINAFRTNLTDKIGFTSASPEVVARGYTYEWKNIDDAFVQGIELSSSVNISKDLLVNADFTINAGKYNSIREDWEGTPFAEDSKYISRFPSTTGNITIEYSPNKWNFVLSGNYQGRMYIDYFKDSETPEKIKHTDPFMLINAKVSREIGMFNLYVGCNNIFNYVQDERHTDDAAFMYAPVFGTMFYAGVSVKINH